MKPDSILPEIPKEFNDDKASGYTNSVNWKKIGSESDHRIGLAHNYMTTFGCGFELLYFSTKHPRPNRVGELMTEDVNPHWFRQHHVNNRPACHPGQHGYPNRFRFSRRRYDPKQRYGTAKANRKQAQRTNGLPQLLHA